MGSPEISQLFVSRGFELMNTTPQQFAEGYKSEFGVITQRIRDLKIEPR